MVLRLLCRHCSGKRTFRAWDGFAAQATLPGGGARTGVGWSGVRALPRHAHCRPTAVRPGRLRTWWDLCGSTHPVPPLGTAKRSSTTTTSVALTQPPYWKTRKGCLPLHRHVRARPLTALLACLHVTAYYVAGCLWPLRLVAMRYYALVAGPGRRGSISSMIFLRSPRARTTSSTTRSSNLPGIPLLLLATTLAVGYVLCVYGSVVLLRSAVWQCSALLLCALASCSTHPAQLPYRAAPCILRASPTGSPLWSGPAYVA